MRVAIVHNAIATGEADPSTLDVLDQARAIRKALRQAGHEAKLIPFGRDVAPLLRRLKRYAPERVFNLVESVDGHAVLHPHAAAILEMIGIPHTGSSAQALDRCTDKVLAKVIMRAAGIPTPEWVVDRGEADWQTVPGPWFLKPALEDASIGIDEHSVVRDPTRMPERLAALRARFPLQPLLIERYIEGREFNLSVLATDRGPRVLPPAEMLFVDYPPGKERILGFRAKWDPNAFEYTHTTRRFDFPAADAGLIERLREVARRCWTVFELNGYARVDLRVDEAANVFVIEINTNPCLSPDAGFAAAVAQGDVAPAQMVQWILEDSVCVPPQTRSTCNSATSS